MKRNIRKEKPEVSDGNVVTARLKAHGIRFEILVNRDALDTWFNWFTSPHKRWVRPKQDFTGDNVQAILHQVIVVHIVFSNASKREVATDSEIATGFGSHLWDESLERLVFETKGFCEVVAIILSKGEIVERQHDREERSTEQQLAMFESLTFAVAARVVIAPEFGRISKEEVGRLLVAMKFPIHLSREELNAQARARGRSTKVRARYGHHRNFGRPISADTTAISEDMVLGAIRSLRDEGCLGDVRRAMVRARLVTLMPKEVAEEYCLLHRSEKDKELVIICDKSVQQSLVVCWAYRVFGENAEHRTYLRDEHVVRTAFNVATYLLNVDAFDDDSRCGEEWFTPWDCLEEVKGFFAPLQTVPMKVVLVGDDE